MYQSPPLKLLASAIFIAATTPVHAADSRIVEFDNDFVRQGCATFWKTDEEIETCLDWQKREYEKYLEMRETGSFGTDFIDRVAYLCRFGAPLDNYWFNVTSCVMTNYRAHYVAHVQGHPTAALLCSTVLNGNLREVEECVDQKQQSRDD